MIVYKTTNLVNNKIYIGKSKYNRKSYLGSGLILKKAIKKYGKENFKKEIIEKCKTDFEVNKKEKYWIKHYNSTNRTIGYNIHTGGQGGKCTPKTAQKIIEIRRKNGTLNHTQETKDKIRQANTGKKPSPETLEKLRKSHLGQQAWNKGLTKETDPRLKVQGEKWSENRKAGKHKEYIQYNKGKSIKKSFSLNCLICNKEFSIIEYQRNIDLDKHKKTCSRQCSHQLQWSKRK